MLNPGATHGTEPQNKDTMQAKKRQQFHRLEQKNADKPRK